jgi:hypothetical protein
VKLQGREIFERELVVVNFRTKFFSDDIRRWKAGARIAIAESCNRQLWFGLQDDFAAFPGRERPDIDYHEGLDAYRFMLKVYCGLESDRIDRITDSSIKGQICAGWEEFVTDDARKKKAIDAIMTDIKADSRFVSAAALDDYKPRRHEISARDLSGQKKSDRVLLIGHLNDGGKLSKFTDGIARVTGNKRAGRVREIVLTHPDAKTLSAMADQMMTLKNSGIIAADVSRVSFKDLSRAIESVDRTYVDIPMGSMPDAEETIVLTWQTRIYQDNTLTHLRGNPHEMGSSSPLWADAALDNYVSPELIRHDMAQRAIHNQSVLENANKAIEYCAELRMRGEQPSHAKVREHLQAPAPVQS